MDKTTSSREDIGIPMGLNIRQSGSESILRQHLGRAIRFPFAGNYEHMLIIWQTKNSRPAGGREPAPGDFKAVLGEPLAKLSVGRHERFFFFPLLQKGDRWGFRALRLAQRIKIPPYPPLKNWQLDTPDPVGDLCHKSGA
ncbi:MAG: hypothetical protein ACP5SH_27445, partial [Syntrophobacteraceae bacterium]